MTTRCNFRCQYFTLKEIFSREYAFLPYQHLLTFEEITSFRTVIAPYGLRKVPITGSEPLIRKDLEVLIRRLRREHPQLEIALTSNGSLLPIKAPELKVVGLDRVTVSLELKANGPLCPGNSIMTEGSWQFVTNAPTQEGACEGFPTVTDDPAVGPIDCHGTLFYRTAIPSNQQGTLFGTLEMLDPDGNLVGITSQAESNPDMLEIDLSEICQ